MPFSALDREEHLPKITQQNWRNGWNKGISEQMVYLTSGFHCIFDSTVQPVVVAISVAFYGSHLEFLGDTISCI